MAQIDIPSSSSHKGGKKHYGDGKGGEQTWLTNIKSTFKNFSQMWRVSEKVCIYRVSKSITKYKPEVYIPLVVSFGPYHHKANHELSRMDEHKLEAVNRMLIRLGTKDVAKLIGEIQRLDPKIRECYEEPINMDGETLSWMFAMDACFILEFLRKWDDNYFSLIFQTGSKENSMFRAILDDIKKLENQIPLFILITLLQLEYGTYERATTELADLLSGFIDFNGFPLFPLSYRDGFKKLKALISTQPPPCHLLDLNRMLIKDMLTNPNTESVIARGTNPNAESVIASRTNPNAESGTAGEPNHGLCGWFRNVGLPGWMQRPSSNSYRENPLIERRSSSDVESLDNSRSTPCAELLTNPNTESSIDSVRNSNVESGTAGEPDHGRCSWLTNVGLRGWMQLPSIIPSPALPSRDSRAASHCETLDDSRSTPCAELLHKAGIKFVPGNLGFQKRRFGKAMLSFPRIVVMDSTEISLRNLMAYEDCQMCSWSPEKTIISHFIRLLDDLIDSERDVSLLRKARIIQSWVGSDEDTARMINGLCDGIIFSSIKDFELVMEKARDHYKSQWKVWISQFQHEHFSKPWYVVSILAATALLVMTFIQTLNSGKK
ncbi:hypothetical protein SUGI_0699910 [Cryptomeria japonica]|uniref:UPF0481 protein At3g47200-like n=1 Tax=Cryptomeria japonica TaxID=3369 RepID=UPI0024149921|nr:UPF0481 protein At3g47200-like [Cryptomeria japonica]GLJ34775.1 hypothetical protein SUGI_0699910 [Cryptomeria japonica]